MMEEDTNEEVVETVEEGETEEVGATKDSEEDKEKNLANSEEVGTLKSKVSEPPPRRRDRVPNIRAFAEITVFGYRVNHSNYRYSVTPPFHTKILWSKTMTGGEAYRFLVGIKNKNRSGKLESKSLPEA